MNNILTLIIPMGIGIIIVLAMVIVSAIWEHSSKKKDIK